MGIKVKGLDGLQQKLRDIERRAAALHGKHRVPLTELFPPAFVRRHSRFANIEALLEASGFSVKTAEDFAQIPDGEWDAFIARSTNFSDWKAMQKAGTAEYVKKKLGH